MYSIIADYRANGMVMDGPTAYGFAERSLKYWDLWCPDDGRPAAGLAECKRLLAGGSFDKERWERLKHDVFAAAKMASKSYDQKVATWPAGAAQWCALAIGWVLNGCRQAHEAYPLVEQAWEKAIEDASEALFLGWMSYHEPEDDSEEEEDQTK